jgi:hypothetical protein
MKLPHNSQKLLILVAAITILLAGCSRSPSETDPSGRSRAEALKGQAENQQQAQVADTVSKLLESFREGPQVPDGWPTQAVPVPPGAKPVASLQRSILPNGAETMSMFYASGRPSKEIQAFFRAQLPKNDWHEAKSQEEGELRWVTAESDVFNGLFMAGPVPSLPPLQSGEEIDVLVILTRPGASPTP